MGSEWKWVLDAIDLATVGFRAAVPVPPANISAPDSRGGNEADLLGLAN